MTNPGGAGAVVVVPVALPPPRSASALADAMVQTTDQSTVRRRWGLILAINNDGTVNVDLAGVVIPNLRVVAGYQPTIGERIILDVVGTDMTVLGATGQSPRRFNRPTGDIEPSIRKTPKPDTLLLNGQTVSRTDYARLFAWVQQEGLLTTAQSPNNLFGAGDGSTTFTLPDFRGRTVVGATDALPLGSKFGNDSVTLATAQMPSHKHNVGVTGSTDSQGSHSHSFSATSSNDPGHGHNYSATTSGGGAHNHAISAVRYTTDSVHNHDGPRDWLSTSPNTAAPGGTASGVGTNGVAAHSHTVSGTTDYIGPHAHTVSGTSGSATAHTHTVTTTVTEQAIGGTTPVDIRQPSIAISWLIWV
jgi:microcystin-dependent protein